MPNDRPLGALDVVTRPAHVYASAPPNLFNFVTRGPGLRSWIMRPLTRANAECPAEGFVSLRNARVLDGMFVVDSDDVLISETAKDSDYGRIEKRFAEHAGKAVDARTLVENAWPFVHVFKSGCANYGHVLVEMLPKLLSLAGQGLGPLNVIVPADGVWSIPLFRTLAELLDLELDFVVPRAPLIQADNLIVCSPVSEHNRRKSETTNAMVRLLIARYGARGAAGSARLYVARGDGEKRRMTNGARIEGYFSDRGYRIVDPRLMPFEEQIAMFARADRVVGALGAGLSNIVFCPEGAEVLMIDPGLYDFFFWDIACLRKQTFSWYFNRPLDMFDPLMLSAPFEVREDALRAAVEMAGLA